ncbi:uncharacterized protein VTP21DRAFT_6763 [Calcarisporiella thermophila]|uniref:uncharacterized protein n=1 Tax=Calcarisporiella thermophila TaxID=911321 RepID=UPI00374394FE
MHRITAQLSRRITLSSSHSAASSVLRTNMHSEATTPQLPSLITSIKPNATSLRAAGSELHPQVFNQWKSSGAQGKPGECRIVYPSEQWSRVAVMGVKEGDAESTRLAAAIGAKSLREQGATTIQIDNMESAHAAAEGAHLALYRFDELKATKSQKAAVELQPLNPSSEGELNWNTGVIYAKSQNLARRLMETPANLMTPTIFAERAKECFEGVKGVEVFIHDKEWAESHNMGSFLSVAKGSAEPLRFVEIHYTGDAAKSDETALALVGKGITFDAGGISLKPAAGMSAMKGDMGGAATVLGTMYGIAHVGIPLNVKAFIPLCENLPSGTANKPGDVVRASNGKTIEIDNTDAEGRLILADALYYASSTFKPRTLIDVATLTGAMAVALGGVYSGVFTNSTSLYKELESAGEAEADPFWRMPLNVEYKKLITKSTTADLINSAGRAGGSCTAAIFLKEFVHGLNPEDEGVEGAVEEGEVGFEDKIRYAHIDIAGVMDTTSDSGYHVKGMSGRPTRSLIEFARRLARA